MPEGGTGILLQLIDRGEPAPALRYQSQHVSKDQPMPDPMIQTERRGDVLIVTLNRPARLNAAPPQMF